MSIKGLPRALGVYYGHLLGELRRIEAPPKTMNRRSRNREAFQAAEPERVARAAKIRELLPRIAFVMQELEPTWRPEDAVIKRPSSGWGEAPPGGWIRAAMAVLQDATDYLTIADIVEEIAMRYDYDLSHVSARQAIHTAVNNSLAKRRAILISDAGTPAAWALRSKVEALNATREAADSH